MKLKAIVFSVTTLISFLSILAVYSSDDISSQYQNNEIIKSILGNEKNDIRLQNIKDIVKLIDETYADLFTKLKSGEKITVFFDPAHGRLENGKLQGEVTNRISSTGLPEEYYSIQFSRKFYKLLSGNKFLRVVTNEDYIRVLRGESSDYKKYFFSENVKFARSEKAFIIISEHMNNVSSLLKSDAMINIPGIHVTLDEAGNRYLAYIKTAHKGYLTLYNKYDLSGLSKSIAYKIKEDLSSKGLTINGWEYGAVADDRFSFFIDFPISVIFEQGFISNPDEEEELRDPEYQQKIVESQYNALIEGIKDVFGIDISGFRVRQVSNNQGMLDLITLSRIAIYYIQNDMPEIAVKTINLIEEKYSNSHYNLIEPYIRVKERIIKAEKYFKECKKALKAKQNKKAKTNLYNAGKITAAEPIFDALTEKYTQYGRRHFRIRKIEFIKKEIYSKITMRYSPAKASLSTPVILAIEDGQSLQDAVEKALSPGPETASRLIKSFDDAIIRERVMAERYSKKKKKYITYWKWDNKKADFREGLYIVVLNKNLKITKVQRVPKILLDPAEYQNHQYLKNSYFAGVTKEKSI